MAIVLIVIGNKYSNGGRCYLFRHYSACTTVSSIFPVVNVVNIALKRIKNSRDTATRVDRS